MLDSGFAHPPNDHLGHQIWLEIIPVWLAKDEVVILVVASVQSTVSELLVSEELKRGYGGLRYSDHPRFVVLRSLDPEACPRLLERLADGERGGHPVEIGPFQGEQFAAAGADR